MIDLDNNSLEIIKSVLSQYLPGIEVQVFGSRVTGTTKTFSDIDLVIMGNKQIPMDIMNNLKFAFSNSSLPIMVDIIDWHAISETFRKKIKADCEALIPDLPRSK